MRRAFIFCTGVDSSLLKDRISSFLEPLGNLKGAITFYAIDEEVKENTDDNIYKKIYPSLASKSSSPELFKELRLKLGNEYIEEQILVIFVGNLNSSLTVKYFLQAIDFFTLEKTERQTYFLFYPILYYYDRIEDYPQIFANLREVEYILNSNSSVEKVFLVSDTIENDHRLEKGQLLDILSFFIAQLPLQERSGLESLFIHIGNYNTAESFLHERLTSRFVSFGINAFYIPFKKIKELHAKKLSEIVLNNLFDLKDEELNVAYNRFVGNLDYFKDFETLKSKIIDLNNKLKKDYLFKEPPLLPFFNFDEEIEFVEEKIVEWQTVLFGGSLNKIRMELEKNVLGYEKEKGELIKSQFEEDFKEKLKNASLDVVEGMPKGVISLFFVLKKYIGDLTDWKNKPPELKVDIEKLESLRAQFRGLVRNRILLFPYFLKASLIVVLIDYAWFFISKIFLSNFISLLGILVISLLIMGYASFKYYICRRSIENGYDKWIEEIIASFDRIVDNFPFEVSAQLAARLLPYVESDLKKVDKLIEEIKSCISGEVRVSEQPTNMFVKELHIDYESEFNYFLETNAVIDNVVANLKDIRVAIYDNGVLVNTDAISNEFQEWLNKKSFEDAESSLTPVKLLSTCFKTYNVNNLRDFLSLTNGDIMLLVHLEEYKSLTLHEVYEMFSQEYRGVVCLPFGLEQEFYNSSALLSSSIWSKRDVTADSTEIIKTSDQCSLYSLLLLAYFPIIQLKQIPAMAKEYWKLPRDEQVKLHCLFRDIDILPKIYQEKRGGGQ